MFTGIIEELAPVVSVRTTQGKFMCLEIDLGELSADVKIGDSIAVNGVCLTATRKRNQIVSFDVIDETLRRTDLGELSEGSNVNIERSLLLSDRIGGHLVTGHIDGTGKIVKVEPEGDGSVKFWVETGIELLSAMIPKGSVALDGISLTLVDVASASFSVCLIPHTISMTTLGSKKQGDYVNIEVDLIGKYVRKFMEQMNP